MKIGGGELWIQAVNDARRAGSFDKAMAILNVEAQKRPLDPVVYYQIAWTHDALGKERDAVPAYEKAIELGLEGNDLRDAFLGLGSTYRTLGMYEKSKRIFVQGIEAFPNYRPLQVFLGLTLFNLEEQAKAIEILLRQLIETTSDEEIKSYSEALNFYSDKLGQIFE